MKFSTFIPLLGAITIGTLNTSCLESKGAAEKATAPPPENGAQFKEGQGLSLTEEMSKAIGLKTEDVGEEKITPVVSLNVSAVTQNTATGWVTPEQAKAVRPGMEVEFHCETTFKGTVEKLEANPLGVMGDSEITITTAEKLTAGEPLKAVLRLPAGDAVAVVPAAALLKTAEGAFVYAVNGDFYVRTPVKTGASDDKFVEITDGLYAGDQIVTTPVMSLWMAELQVLRGGKACTCGH
ncbi:MAG: efflux RND transporter periplasmic adaptor subunit [Verrucomicrobiae bacterium]|nr:efflux RND transporter periplasmic adaptor subunit [Verrucomicrobiae bacterium]